MRLRVAVLLLAVHSATALWAQTPSSSAGTIQGTVTDGQNKPVAGAIVNVTRTFATPKGVTTPFSQSVKTASDGSFLVQGVPPGTYSYCAQASDDSFLNGCRWGAPPLDIRVSVGQKARTVIRVAKGSILKVRLLDPGKHGASLASQNSNGKNSPSPVPSLPILMGVWDSHGRFLAVHHVGKDKDGLNYQLAVPFDTPLSFQIVSSKVKLSDSAGASLPASAAGPAGGLPSQASSTAFQHHSGDPNPKSFQFTITGVNP